MDKKVIKFRKEWYSGKYLAMRTRKICELPARIPNVHEIRAVIFHEIILKENLKLKYKYKCDFVKSGIMGKTLQ